MIPDWVAPDHNAVRDLLNVAPVAGETNPYAAGVADAAQWATGWPDIGYDDAAARMAEHLEQRADRHAAGVADVLAWLIGCAPPPIRLPQRHPDGTLVTADEHYQRWLADQYRPTPEARHAARQQADLDYARSVRLAGLG